MITSKIETFDMDAVFAGDGLSGLDRSRALASFARAQFAEAQEINRKALGRVPESDSYVDGVRSDALERVRPDGTIVFEFELTSDAVAYCYEMVQKHSPVLKGRYKASHRIYADGVEVQSPEATIGADEVTITNIVPYARKIEGDRKSGRKSQSGLANGVYEAVANMAKRRFHNAVKIKFLYVNPMGAASLDSWARQNAGRLDGAKKQERQYQKNIRQPAIMITFR